MTKRRIEIEDLLKIQSVNDPQVSPDGSHIVFAVTITDMEKNHYLSHLWMAETKSGEAVQHTRGQVMDATPRWSPDGLWIAFLRAVDGITHLWVISVAGGEAYQLDSLNEGVLGVPQWSPDGTRIAFTFRPTHPDWTKAARSRRANRGISSPPRVIKHLLYKAEGIGFVDMRQHIWVCDVTNGVARQITDGDTDDGYPVWRPDGEMIAFLSNRSDDPDVHQYKANLWLTPTAGGHLIEVPLPYGYKRNLSWSPDGKRIAFIGCETTMDPFAPQNDRLWVITVDPPPVCSARCLTADLDRFVGNATISDMREVSWDDQNPIWSADSKRLYFPVSDSGNTHLYAVLVDGESYPEPVVNGSHEIISFSTDDHGAIWALLIARPTRPAELFLIRRSMSYLQEPGLWSELKQLTTVNKSLLENIALSEPEEFRFASFDSLDIQGWLLKPPDFDPMKKYPLLLCIHGGPNLQYGNTFFYEFQAMAARGIVVLYTNPRGSLGVGEKFVNSILGDWGSLDYKDLMASIDYAVNLPYVDSERMAITGVSYGGYMTAWTVAHNNRFCCAIADSGCYNYHSAMGTKDWPPLEDGYWPGNAWDRPERLWEQSPLRYAADIQTPLLLIQSEGDLRCPIEQAEQLFAALKWLKREVIFIRYPIEANHSLSVCGPPDLRVDRLQQISSWFDQYLGTKNRN